MSTTIDRAGRVVVPKAVREEARLRPGTPIEIRCRHGVVEIEAAPLPVVLRKRGGLVVASPRHRVPPLRVRDIEDTRRRIRRERGVD